MRFNPRARLDTSQVSDARGGGGSRLPGGGVAVGGGGLGIVGIIIYVVIQLVGGSGGGGAAASVLGQLSQGNGSGTADNTEIASNCKSGTDANNKLECAVVASIDSIQGYWAKELPTLGARYTESDTVFFTGRTSTGCGAASSGVGPFYCPADKLVYIDLDFYNELKTQFGAQGGTFVDAYVLAHEYGHHVQDLLGTSDQVRAGATGPSSGSVRLELQADCYAGVWAHEATTVPDSTGQPLISDVTADDISRALDTAGRIGDDYIQKNLGGGRVDRSKFTHGSSAQRRKWFTAGYRTGRPGNCDTFAATDLG